MNWVKWKASLTGLAVALSLAVDALAFTVTNTVSTYSYQFGRSALRAKIASRRVHIEVSDAIVGAGKADSSGSALSEAADLEFIVFGDDSGDAAKVSFVKSRSTPEHCEASIGVNSRHRDRLHAASSVHLRGSDAPRTAKATLVRVELEQGTEVALIDESVADTTQDLSVRFQVESRVAGAAVVNADFCEASAQNVDGRLDQHRIDTEPG